MIPLQRNSTNDGCARTGGSRARQARPAAPVGDALKGRPRIARRGLHAKVACDQNFTLRARRTPNTDASNECLNYIILPREGPGWGHASLLRPPRPLPRYRSRVSRYAAARTRTAAVNAACCPGGSMPTSVRRGARRIWPTPIAKGAGVLRCCQDQRTRVAPIDSRLCKNWPSADKQRATLCQRGLHGDHGNRLADFKVNAW